MSLLCRVAGNTVIPYGMRVPAAVRHVADCYIRSIYSAGPAVYAAKGHRLRHLANAYKAASATVSVSFRPYPVAVIQPR